MSLSVDYVMFSVFLCCVESILVATDHLAVATISFLCQIDKSKEGSL